VAQLYNAIVNVGSDDIGNKGFIKYRKITSLERFKLFLSTQYPKWVFATVYDAKTRQKISVIKPN
jgi:hypothetical protein